MVRDPGSDPMQGLNVHDRRKYCPLHRELLHAMEQSPSRSPVALHRLLLQERIDSRVLFYPSVLGLPSFLMLSTVSGYLAGEAPRRHDYASIYAVRIPPLA